ncbi:hypothetical protein [Arsenophonus sp.]|uniref:OspG family effector kinase n=1 Tax=Arsenophonus sp. TaxID=1872640 RepID=UPI0038798DD6
MMTNNCSFGVVTRSNICNTTSSNQLNNESEILKNTLGLNDSEVENFIHDFNIDSKKLSDIYHAISEDEINHVIYPTEVIKSDEFLTGKRIGSGSFGVVYEHHENEHLVVKKMKNSVSMFSSSDSSNESSSDINIPVNQESEFFKPISHLLEEAKEEADYFRKYYGENAAKVIFTDNDVYIEMLKIPGKRMDEIPKGGFRFNAPEKFWEMIVKLDRKEIWHGDISPHNVLYDYETNTFYPVDISNRAKKYNDLELSISSNDIDTMLSVAEIESSLKRIKENLEY